LPGREFLDIDHEYFGVEADDHALAATLEWAENTYSKACKDRHASIGW